MKKTILLCITVLIMVLTMPGCNKEEKTIDVAALGDALLNNITYTDEMAAIDLETAGMIYYFGEASVTNACIYESSGATAEEIAVFECADEASADLMEKAVADRIAEQKESFENYVPEELVKLDNAILVRSGKYVILSVSADAEQARKIIDDTI